MVNRREKKQLRGPNGPAPEIRKRSIKIGTRKTSVSLEDEFWDSIIEIAAECEHSTPDLFNADAEGRDRAKPLVGTSRFHAESPQADATKSVNRRLKSSACARSLYRQGITTA